MAIREFLFLIITAEVNGFIVQEPTQNASLHELYTRLKLEIDNLDYKYSNLQTEYANIQNENTNMLNDIKNQSYGTLQKELSLVTSENLALKNEQQNMSVALDLIQNITWNLKSENQLQGNQLLQLENQYSKINEKFENQSCNNDNGTSSCNHGYNIPNNGTSNQSKRVAFSVSLPSRETIGRDGPLKFTNAFYNDDDAFNFTSAMFECEIPGIYFFSSTIIRGTGGYTESFCYLMINSHARAYLGAYSYQGAYGYPSGTATIIYHMDEGDTAYVGMCGVIQQITGYSHFNGFLIQAD